MIKIKFDECQQLACEGVVAALQGGSECQLEQTSMNSSVKSFSNLVFSLIKISLSVPIGPFLCLAVIISAIPLLGLSSLSL